MTPTNPSVVSGAAGAIGGRSVTSSAARACSGSHAGPTRRRCPGRGGARAGTGAGSGPTSRCARRHRPGRDTRAAARGTPGRTLVVDRDGARSAPSSTPGATARDPSGSTAPPATARGAARRSPARGRRRIRLALAHAGFAVAPPCSPLGRGSYGRPGAARCTGPGPGPRCRSARRTRRDAPAYTGYSTITDSSGGPAPRGSARCDAARGRGA